MKPHALAVATACLIASVGSAFASDRWCGDTDCTCPQKTLGWMLYADSNHGAPDFWWTASVDVREIFICRHGIQFLFITQQRGQPHWTALVFPKPSPVMLAARLILEPGSDRLQKEFEHFQGRYEALLAELERISGGTLVEGTRLTFDKLGPDTPTIIPNHRLVLCWRGEELKLRGYLDVYFTLVS